MLEIESIQCGNFELGMKNSCKKRARSIIMSSRATAHWRTCVGERDLLLKCQELKSMHCVIAEFLQNGQDECWVEIPRRFAPRNDIKECAGLALSTWIQLRSATTDE